MNLEKEIFEISLKDIMPNRFQPREIFEDSALQELAQSIKEHGVIQPIIVRKVGDKYEIIAGERRFRASQLAGKETIPALVRDIDDKEAAKIALLENLQRKDLTPIEEAKTYQTILKLDNITQDELAQNLGKSQSAVANKLRLLNLDEEVQTALLNSKISERHARSLLPLDHEKQRELLHKIINERLTVRQVDEEIMKLTGKMPEAVPEEGEITMPNNNEMPTLNNNILNEASNNLESINNNAPTSQNPINQSPMPNISQELNNQSPIEPINNPNPIPQTAPNQTVNPVSNNNLNVKPINNNIIPPTPVSNEPKVENNSQILTTPNNPINQNVQNNVPNTPANINIPNVNNDQINNQNNLNYNIPGTSTETEEKPNDINNQIITPPLPNINENPINNNQNPAPQPPKDNIFDKLRVKPEVANTPVSSKESQVNAIKTDIPTVINSEPNQNPQPTYDNIYDLRFAINNFRQAIQNTEKFGFKVKSEEIDNPNSYQIIINIEKQS